MDKINLSTDYIKNYLNSNKIIFSTNIHDNNQSGFQNYGPIGVAIKNNIINVWRKNFVFNSIYEIECPTILNEQILTRSGHIKKFNDLGIVFYDKLTGKINTIKRADHFIEDIIEQLKLQVTYIEDENFIKEFIEKNNLYNKEKEYIEIKPQSLMFKMDNLYLRPEIAQSIFVEFKHFYEMNSQKLPFGIAQVGKSYRNEICDKPFVRLREFSQAEVEYFYNPHDEFIFCIPENYINKKCFILSSEMQEQKLITLQELNQYVKNHILLKFMFKLYCFAEEVGLDIMKLRFRQHRKDEMAHYANDCWDLEANIFDKWLEITGIADRGNYDLTVHDKNESFLVKKSDTPVIKYKLLPDKKKIFSMNTKEEAVKILNLLPELIVDSLPDILSEYYQVTKFNHYDLIRPHVVEPSIGIDRVFYSIICHNLFLRDDGLRPCLHLTKHCRPYDIMLAQLSNHPDLISKLKNIYQSLKLTPLKIFLDMSSTTIGKRYTRADELGIKYSVTIDFETLNDNTVTIRDSYNMSQIRVHIDELNNSKYFYL